MSTLAERITQTLTRAGCRMPSSVARSVISQVRDHDHSLATTIRHRPLPLPDCPDGCVVGAEWHRRALNAERELAGVAEVRDQWIDAARSWRRRALDAEQGDHG